jgi:Na+/H+ antiporter NhaA
MSFFVTDLAFQCPEMRYVAKLSILLTSAIAGILGSLELLATSKKPAPETPNPDNNL